MRKAFTGLILGLCCWAAASVSQATNYALCTGLNKYKTSYVSSSSFLNGCVPDAKNVYTNITLRGEWDKANATQFLNSEGTFAAVSNKLMEFASAAVSGDVVLYYHSSHGYQDSGKNTGICMYDQDMPDSSFAKILANFKSGVKVIIVLDTCHSGGMFKSLRRDGSTRALDTGAPFAFAQRVNEELAAIRADEAARGIKAAKLQVLECAWVTAADYNQYSWDGDEGGAFTECYIGSVKSGACDKSPYGNGDSYATFMEMFNYAVEQDETHGQGAVGTEDYTMPQCTNTTILSAVRFGWVGKEEPSGVRFDPIPEQTATVGEEMSYTLTASNSDGSSGKITFSVASATAPAGSYSLDSSSGAFSFTPATDGSFTFNFVGTNTTAKTGGKAAMTVTASLAAPAKLSNSGITASSFTANWGAVAGAASYLLDVASSDFGGAKAADDALLSEDFAAFTGTSADRSSTLDEYLTGTGWTGSKVFENAGSAKLGSSSYAGWIATPELDLSSGGTVSFELTQYNTDANTVTVSIISGGDETKIGTATPGASETVEFTIPAASASTSVKIATSAKRAIIDDLVISSGGGADILSAQPVAGTSYTVDALETSTYYWRVRAVGNAKGPYSATEEVTLNADPNAPPSIRAIDDIEIEVGETATATVKVSAPVENPVTSLSITAGDAAAKLGEDGVFTFAPEAAGVYPFTITAVNANGSVDASFTVTATLAEPETPEVPTFIDSDAFTAEWTAVPGAESYELVVIEGTGGSSGGGGGGGEGGTLTETFDGAKFSPGGTSYTAQSIEGDLGTWTSSECQKNDSGPIIRATGTLTAPAIEKGVAGVEVDYIWPYSDSSTFAIDLYVNDTKVGSQSVTGGTPGTASYSFAAVSGSATVKFVNTSTTSKKDRVIFDTIRITTASKSIAKVVGDVVFSNNVGNVTSFDVTGLQPNTEYTFAFRAIAGDEATDWSEPVSVKTADGPAAPSWTAIPAQSAAVGYPFSIDLSAYVSGVPTPALALTAGTAELSGTVLSFTPDAVGDYTFTVTASNTSGDPADATFTVSAVEHVPTKYAVCVGINEYAEISGLEGCVNDSIYIENSLIERGGWAAENVVRLNDKQATKAAIRGAIAAVAAKAQAGDTFVYQHSSHGGQFNDTTGDIITDEEGKATFLCVYDEDYDDNTTAYNDYEIAADMATFNTGVKVAVIVDACHSGGLFKSKEEARAAAASFDLAGRVTAIMDADRAQRKARGENVAKTLDSSEIGWAVACEYYETSYDGGFFHTDEWLTNPSYGDEYWVGDDEDGYYDYPASYKQGGVFTTSAAWGWWNGDADADPEAGDNDGLCDVHEFWKAGYDFCSVVGEFWWDEPEYNYYPQCTNIAVLKSIELGYAGMPTLDAPVANSAADVTASSFTASWSAVADATGYRVQVATDESFSTGASTDTLTAEDFAATSTTYTEFSGVAKDSGAVYAGKSAKNGTGAIQLNTGKDAGIWTTASGGNATRVAVVWNDATTTSKPRSLLVYGSAAALDSAAAVKAATHLGTIVYGTDTALDIVGSFAYVGILPDGGALYLDSVSVNWGTAGSGSSIVVDQEVGNVTSFEVTGLEAETDYWYRVQALGDPVDSDFSNVIALTTEAGTPYAPVWSDIPAQSGVAGEMFEFDASDFVKASPAATITLVSSTAADGDYEFEDGYLVFTPPAEGSYEFEFQAANSLGESNATMTVVAAAAPVTVPELTLSNPTADSFKADWTACTGVSSYTLQVSTAEFKGVRDGEAILSEDFSGFTATNSSTDVSGKLDDYTAVAGWTGSKIYADAGRIKLGTGSANGYIVTPAEDIPAGAALTCKIAQYGSDTGTVDIQLSANGGEFASLLDEAIKPAADGETCTVNFAEAVSGAKIKFVSSAKRFYLDDVVISGSGGGSSVLTFTVEGTSKTVDGLEPETTYYARVKGAADWSAVKSITTEADEPVAPAWNAIPNQTVVAGETLVLDLNAYVIGSPKPTITADAGTVEAGVLTVSFAEAGDYAITVTAENSGNSATTTIAVTVMAAPVTVPELTLSNPTANSFDAEWTACDGVESYTLQVSKAEFKGVRDGDAILSEDFSGFTATNSSTDVSGKLDEYTSVTGWTGSKVYADAGRIKLGTGSANGSIVTPAVDIPAGATLTCKIAQYGSDTGTVDIRLSANGGEFASLLDEAIKPVADGDTYTVDFAEAVAGAKIQFVSSAKRFYLDDVVISGSGGGSSVLSFTVEGTTKTVDGLEPETTYYARVKGAAEWSEVKSITTEADAPTAPAWTAIPAQEVAVGATLTLDLTAYVSGSPKPAITANGVALEGGVFTFTGETEGPFTFVLVASNGIEPDATAELTVTVVPAPAAKYALCVGVNDYDYAAWESQGWEITPLHGTVNDATYFRKNLTERGGWAESDITFLTNETATKAAIQAAIAGYAAKAKAGDTFVYQHSSHGLNHGEDAYVKEVGLATYATIYEDFELAEDLAAFASGVKVVIVIDACHSGGMFKGMAKAGSFDIAARVCALIDAKRTARKARGEDVSKSISSEEIGWVTAADFDETSKDAGAYDTGDWVDAGLEGVGMGKVPGGVFLASFTWGGWNGKADVSGTGDGDGWLDAYEGWAFATPVCAEFDHTPQFLHEDVLRSVELGWIGEAAPSEAIVFDPVPGAEVGIGEEATLNVVAKNADGTTDGITLRIVEPSPEELLYTFADGTLTFTPEEDGLFLFTVQAVNGRTSATKLLGVTAVLSAPVALDATDVADASFTANWTGVDAAEYYQLQVSTDPSFPMAVPDMVFEEGFDEVTSVDTLPEGWEFAGKFGTYPTTGGEAAPSIKLANDGDTLLTPVFELTRTGTIEIGRAHV